jgi:hypothetical protein
MTSITVNFGLNSHQVVKVTPGMTLASVLQAVCEKQKLSPSSYCLMLVAVLVRVALFVVTIGDDWFLETKRPFCKLRTGEHTAVR